MYSKRTVHLILLLFCLCGVAVAEVNQEGNGDFGGVPLHHMGSQLILVKVFSTDNVEVEGSSKENTEKVAIKKKKRIKKVLAQKLQARLKKNGFNSDAYSEQEKVQGALVVDGEFVKIHKSKARMTVRFWVYHTGNPKKRIFQREVDAVSTAGPVSMASVAMNNLAHNVIAHLKVNLPEIMEKP